ncbi:hypothetical protein DUI87_07626 [Hirundo rustica rustica]|uniref:Uncharacterized protein n=1 Tax=Hirundo rustica rustica TaxID=333673 RepID=A0A3M0KQJ5_HIRRU|nr:hypothetical protein DUI87_07626 [Hirundo rustica rustica]
MKDEERCHSATTTHNATTLRYQEKLLLTPEERCNIHPNSCGPCVRVRNLNSDQVAFDYDSALHYKTSELLSRVGRERDEILATGLAYSQLCDMDYHGTVAEYEVTAYDPPLSLDKL